MGAAERVLFLCSPPCRRRRVGSSRPGVGAANFARPGAVLEIGFATQDGGMTLPKRPEAETARILLLEHGLTVALRKAVSGRAAAKRARNRRAFQYWSIVEAEIASLGSRLDPSTQDCAIGRGGTEEGLHAK